MNDAHTSRRKPRRRGRRARRGRGRRVLIMAAVLGPVLAVVFVAELATEGYWRAPAPKPSPEAPERPVADRTESEPGTGSDSAEPGGAGTAAPVKGVSRKPEGSPSSDTAPPSSPPPGATRDPAPPDAPDPTYSAPPSPAAPTPTSAPSPTCKRFLWWCA